MLTISRTKYDKLKLRSKNLQEVPLAFPSEMNYNVVKN